MIEQEERVKKQLAPQEEDYDDDYAVQRAQLRELINDPDGKLGFDENNCFWIAKILDDGSQIWASSYEGTIRSAGSNQPICKFALKKQRKLVYLKGLSI